MFIDTFVLSSAVQCWGHRPQGSLGPVGSRSRNSSSGDPNYCLERPLLHPSRRRWPIVTSAFRWAEGERLGIRKRARGGGGGQKGQVEARKGREPGAGRRRQDG